MPHPRERRASPRCNAVQNQSRIEFPAPQAWRSIEARLVNISRGGALVDVENPPPIGTSVFLRIEHPVKTDWVSAAIVRLVQDRKIALNSPQSCPDDLFLAGTIGIDVMSLIGRRHRDTASDD